MKKLSAIFLQNFAQFIKKWRRNARKLAKFGDSHIVAAAMSRTQTSGVVQFGKKGSSTYCANSKPIMALVVGLLSSNNPTFVYTSRVSYGRKIQKRVYFTRAIIYFTCKISLLHAARKWSLFEKWWRIWLFDRNIDIDSLSNKLKSVNIYRVSQKDRNTPITPKIRNFERKLLMFLRSNCTNNLTVT